ncbi:MAG: PHP domain-containing protein [Nocardioides sp.]|nr:PHP domain-containing protein [Nocardioidaceae bacterium]MCB8957472.1 PHP domain-containing protein [Nocardioides sp.]
MSDRHLDRRALLLSGAGIASAAAVLRFDPAAAGSTVTKKFKGRFTPANKADWHYLPFDVPRGVREVRVSYRYPDPIPGPGYSSNVIDIGIFDSSGNGLGNAAGFRGWSGGARKSFRLSRTSATPGYLAGPISPGRWKVALGPYQIVSPVDYEVRVTLVFGPRGPAFVPTPAPTSATPPEPKSWWRGDLHIHTVHSDGSQTQTDVLTDARAAGLDFIGSADHNTDSAQLTWGSYVEDDFLVIAGEEVTTRAGHWVATGLPAGTWVDWRYRPEDDKLADFTQLVRDLGGLAIAAHPDIGVPSIRWDFDPSFAEMDAVEVWNGPWDGFDGATVTRWVNLLNNGTYKPAVGNSDSHNRSQTVGLPQNVVRAGSLSTTAIIEALRAGHSWIAESSAVDLDFSATLDDVSGECGDHVPSSAGDQVAVHLEVTGVPGCTAFLYGPRASYGKAAADESGRIVFDRTVPGGTAYVRAEVRRGTTPVDQLVALTNPIFLTA